MSRASGPVRASPPVIVLVYEARITGGEARTGPEALDIRVFPPEEIRGRRSPSGRRGSH